MSEQAMTLHDQEVKLVRTIRRLGVSREAQDAVIATLIDEIETLLAQHPPKKPMLETQPKEDDNAID